MLLARLGKALLIILAFTLPELLVWIPLRGQTVVRADLTTNA